MMVSQMLDFLQRIETNSKILGGKPVIKGTRIPVYIILLMLRDGSSFDDIIKEYPKLSPEDIKASLDYSMYLVNHPDELEIIEQHPFTVRPIKADKMIITSQREEDDNWDRLETDENDRL
jgi:uncharacterized protein (DUF433 family)